MTACAFCQATEPRMMNAPHWIGARETGYWIRVDVCAGEGCRAKITNRPRAPRRPRTPQPVPATDYNMLCAFVAGRKGQKL